MHETDTTEVYQLPDGNVWVAKNGNVTAIGATHDEALMKLGRKIYEAGTLKPETTKLIETMFEGYDAIVELEKTNPAVAPDVEHVHQLVQAIRMDIIHKNEDALVGHLNETLDIIHKWL